jgi:hypothetical protein
MRERELTKRRGKWASGRSQIACKEANEREFERGMPRQYLFPNYAECQSHLR